MASETTAYIEISPYQEILSGMNFILSISTGVVKLTGPNGVGKTRLLQQLHKAMKEEKQEMVLFFTPPVSPKEIEDAVRRQLRLDRDLPFPKALTLAVLARPFDQQRLIIVFDEVERIEQDTLLSTTQFLDIIHHEQPLISLVLCGDESVNVRLQQPVYQPLVRDTLLSYELNPLTKEQLQVFARALLPAMGLKPFEIRNGVLEKLYVESGGLPGAVPALLEQMSTQDLSKLITTPPPVEAAAAPVTADQTALTPEEKLVSAARAEREATPRWQLQLQQWQKPLQTSALAAGLLIAGVVAWPRVSPLVADLYRTVAGSTPTQPTTPATPAPAVTEPVVAPAEVVAIAAPEPVVEIPAPAEVATVAEAPVETPVPEPTAAAPVVPDPAPEVVATTPEPAPVVPAPAAEPVVVATADPAVPAAPAPAPQQVTTLSGDAAELERVVQQWLDAWEQQQVDAFFSYYHTDFAPLYQNTRAAWRADRQSRIAAPAAIQIELEEFRVGTASPLGTTVSFWMTYRAPNYADRTLKEVLIGPDVDGQWRILQEFNREVAVLPRDAFGAAPAQIAAVQQGTTAPAVAGAIVPVAVLPGPSTLSTPSAVTPPQTDEAGIGSFIAQWLNAWQAQDVDSYFSYYHPDFVPASMASMQAWRNDRILKITRPQAIRLQMDELQVLETGAQTAQVEFLMTYHSTHYADRTLKALQLGKIGNGDWRITEERNRRVEPLPLVRLLTALVTPPFTVDIASL